MLAMMVESAWIGNSSPKMLMARLRKRQADLAQAPGERKQGTSW